MNNKIIHITKEEGVVIKASAMQDEDVFFAEINGAEIRTEEDYVQAMAYTFKFPHELPKRNIGWYNDYINDLSWIKQKNIVMCIHDYELMLVNDLKTKHDIISGFKELILPWWESEIVGHLVGGVPKGFMVYLEN